MTITVLYSLKEIEKLNLKVSKMIDSIKTFGLVNPIVVDQYKQIIDGQNRFECCKTLNIPIRYSVFHVEKAN